MWYYPVFKPSMWVLFEVAVNSLTCVRERPYPDDVKKLTDHIEEMLQIGVRPTLSKHGTWGTAASTTATRTFSPPGWSFLSFCIDCSPKLMMPDGS